MTITPATPPKPVAPDALTLWRARVQVAILEDLTSTGTCVADNLHRVGVLLCAMPVTPALSAGSATAGR